MPATLSARERAHLKSRAHALEPVVHIGHGGLTDAVMSEVDRALTAHELIKIRISAPDRHQRAEVAEAVSARADAAMVQQVGKVAVLWRPRPADASA